MDRIVTDFTEEMMIRESGTLKMITVYDHPTDYPNEFVARLVKVTKGIVHITDIVALSDTLEGVRKAIPVRELILWPRAEQDDPCIVETWL